MIKNVVFDLGNVLFKFDSKALIKSFNKGKYNKKIDDVLFGNWSIRDKGEITDGQFISLIEKQLNEEEMAISKNILKNWISCLKFDNKVLSMISDLKNHKINIFVLSNIPLDFAKSYKEISELKDVDDALFSSQVNLLKPDIKIFKKAIEKFGINPKDSVYIDDLKSNVIVAKNLGFKGYIYKSNIRKIYNKIIKENKNGF